VIDFRTYLINNLGQIIVDLNYDFNLIVSEEQSYFEKGEITSNTLVVVYKFLSGLQQFNSTSLPVQIMMLSEQNSLDKAKNIMQIFAETKNLTSFSDGSDYVKQSYATPVVMTNYLGVGAGYRSLIYVSGTLVITESVKDFTSITIGGVATQVQGLQVSYSASPSTIPLPDVNIELAQSTKQIAVLTLSFSLPLLNTTFCNNLLGMLNVSFSGSTKFSVSMVFGNTTITHNFLVSQLSINAQPGQIPQLLIGMVR
jgi:hypothetical protein